jgi:hypothetical protein
MMVVMVFGLDATKDCNPTANGLWREAAEAVEMGRIQFKHRRKFQTQEEISCPVGPGRATWGEAWVLQPGPTDPACSDQFATGTATLVRGTVVCARESLQGLR